MSNERLRGERDRSIITASRLAMDVAERDSLIVEYKAEIGRLRAENARLVADWKEVARLADIARAKGK